MCTSACLHFFPFWFIPLSQHLKPLKDTGGVLPPCPTVTGRLAIMIGPSRKCHTRDKGFRAECIGANHLLHFKWGLHRKAQDIRKEESLHLAANKDPTPPRLPRPAPPCPCPGSGSTLFLSSSLLNRVQKEQLAAIFKLMKDNKDTFGEMSDGDMQEQLRLYDM